MSVIAATESAFHKHPALIIGSLVGLVSIGYILTRGGGSGGGTTVMQYSVGPSDASVQAGAAIQIAQIQANAATAQTVAAVNGNVSLAGINAGVSTQAISAGTTQAQLAATVAQSQQQYGYLTVLSNNATGAHVSDNETELGVVQSNNSANVQIQQSNNAAYTTAQAQQLNYNLNQQVVAVNAALAGSVQAQLASQNQQYNDQIFSAIDSSNGTISSQTLDELRMAQQSAVQSINSSLTSADWQAFHG